MGLLGVKGKKTRERTDGEGGGLANMRTPGDKERGRML